MSEPAIFHPPTPSPAPTIGSVVRYRLSADDVRAIARQRDETGARGNPVWAGWQYPAVIVRVWGDTPQAACSLHVHLDGPDLSWATSRHLGDQNGNCPGRRGRAPDDRVRRLPGGAPGLRGRASRPGHAPDPEGAGRRTPDGAVTFELVADLSPVHDHVAAHLGVSDGRQASRR